MINKYAKSHKLSIKQYEILCSIQRVTYEKDAIMLKCLPLEVVKVAESAQKFWSSKNETEGKKEDEKLCELVKKYWNKNGLPIMQ